MTMLILMVVLMIVLMFMVVVVIVIMFIGCMPMCMRVGYRARCLPWHLVSISHIVSRNLSKLNVFCGYANNTLVY